MTTRRRPPKHASSANGGDPAAVLLEEVRSQMKVVIEAVQGCAQKGDVETGFESMNRGFDCMNLRFDVLTAQVARKADGAAQDALERRVTALEQRSGR